MFTVSKHAPLKLLLGPLVASLIGCATTSPPQTVAAPVLPTPPADLMEPIPLGNWSERARQNFQLWRQRLTSPKPE